MWSRHNVVWLRRRWASQEDDPGRVVRLAASVNGSEPGARRRRLSDAVRREFLARALVIDCPHDDCSGMLLTGAREIERSGGSGSRIVFRCTREPEGHEVTVTMDPYTADEVERLKASLYRGERLVCVRCGTALELGSVASKDGWAKSLQAGAAFYCNWCGVKWVAPAELSERAG
ncbi:MAG: hypothetical protein JSV86_01990 [Gemmatimonadota bacterium]|nr:MAG: hypothetical protein JSV86_01990 [Gemmatimonadota bacterium]